jgi:CheY-like chemotaxis protein
MSLTLPGTLSRNDTLGTDQFNRVQSQLAREGIRQRRGRMPATEKALLSVLVVDDERDAADVLALLVWNWGHEVRRAYSGAAALSMAAQQAPDVVLLDIAMPRMDGCQLAARLRGDVRLQDCFLIAMTGCAETANRLRCQEAGIDLFLIKPVETSVLETLLELEGTRLGRSRRAKDSDGVMPKISATGQLADDPWDVVPHCNPTTTVVL